MYLPAHFEENRPEALHALIAAHPLGALVLSGPNGLDANHVPFEFDASAGAHGTLRAHVARANPVWQEVQAQQDVLVIFQGPTGYISPNWYPSKHEAHRQVPTYNYLVVHAHGRITVRDDEAFVRGFVARLTRRMEAGEPAPWKMGDAPRDYIDQMLAAIVGHRDRGDAAGRQGEALAEQDRRRPARRGRRPAPARQRRSRRARRRDPRRAAASQIRACLTFQALEGQYCVCRGFHRIFSLPPARPGVLCHVQCTSFIENRRIRCRRDDVRVVRRACRESSDARAGRRACVRQSRDRKGDRPREPVRHRRPAHRRDHQGGLRSHAHRAGSAAGRGRAVAPGRTRRGERLRAVHAAARPADARLRLRARPLAATHARERRAVRVRRALLRRRVARAAGEGGQHGFARRARNVGGVGLERLSDARPSRRFDALVLRGGGGRHHARALRQVAGSACEAANHRRDPGAERPAPRPRARARRLGRARDRARGRARRRYRDRAAGRTRAGRRRGAGRPHAHRRVADHRREPAGREGTGRTSDGRFDQRRRRDRDRDDGDRRRNDARADHPAGRIGAGGEGADPAAGGSGVGGVRAGDSRDRARDAGRLVRPRRERRDGGAECGGGARDRVPVRARTRDARRDHGGDGRRGAARRADQGRRGARTRAPDQGRRVRQDRHADGRPSGGDGVRNCAGDRSR